MAYENDMNGNYQSCERDDDIQLEPRLSEFLKKKKYFANNRIEMHNIEKEYDITERDMMKIRAYMRGDKKQNNNSTYSDMIDPSEADFPSSKFKKDARLDRIKKKQKTEESAQTQRHNYGLINRGYDMYRNDRPFASACGDDFKGNFHPNEWFNKNSRHDDYNNPHIAQVQQNRKSFARTNTYVNPKSRNNGYLQNEAIIENDPHSIDAIIGNLDSYRTRVDSSYDNYRGGKREVENVYREVPYRMTPKERDIEVDTYVRFGSTPSRNGKSLGYPNPMEHYFDYISGDIQHPDHVVNRRGAPSRLLNKETARFDNNTNHREMLR